MRSNVVCLFLFLSGLTFQTVFANTSPDELSSTPENRYLDLSLQDLLSIEVTSVSKTEQNLGDVATAIYVISAEDIRRSGALTVPDLLRTVPGINVAQIDGDSWAISARGFNSLRANKLLVLVDGRSIYSPLYGGVLWGSQEMLLEDIERIEVIRGSGGTIWGANAVNGVINIMTRNAKDSQGTLLTAGAAQNRKAILSARHGGEIGDGTYYRVYAKAHNTGDTTQRGKIVNTFGRDDGFELIDDPQKDESRMMQAGFRVDRQKTTDKHFTLQGDLYYKRFEMFSELAIPTAPGKALIDQENMSGINLLGRWQRQMPDDASTMGQLYFDQNTIDSTFIQYKQYTIDAEFQYQFETSENNSLIWGLGYRGISNNIDNTYSLYATNENRYDNLFSSFIQNEINLAPYNTKLTLGSKFERNDYSGVEVQPSVRLVWAPRPQYSLWMAASRAVHTPTRLDHDGNIDVHLPFSSSVPPGPMTISIRGNPELKSEELISYEAGFRSQLHKTLSADLAFFYNDYQFLRGRVAGTPSVENGVMIIPSIRANNLSGSSVGAELLLVWQVSDWWQLKGNYSYLDMTLNSEINEQNDEDLALQSPKHQLNIVSNMMFPNSVDLNFSLRYVSDITNYDRDTRPATEMKVPAYVELDARVSWQVKKNFKLSLIGNNLLNKQHLEFPDTVQSVSQEVRRAVYSEMRIDF
ncbi:MAG TPA: TonB-dependent receptor [Gammaproteobacteria bacterium]|nr:TonB-dependent receptor [Gammaproteobacteria bacterium]